MRATFTSLAFLAMAVAANAQFSLTPKAGLEPTRTTVNYNDLRCLSPLGSYISPNIGLRLDYKFKKTHGPYIGLSTNRSLVSMRFSDPETGMNNYTASAGDRQVRIEGGYLFSSKPIYFKSGSGNKSAAKASPAKSQAKQGCSKYVAKSSCATRSSCGSKSKSPEKLMAKNKGWNVRIQPSAGFAYNTGSKSNLVTNDNGATYQYNAGNWKTALMAGTDLEFGRGRDRLFTVGFQYLKGLGNNPGTIVTQTGTKATTTYLSSRSSGYNITLGIPFTLSKNRQAKHRDREIYKIREVKKRCIYKAPCRKA